VSAAMVFRLALMRPELVAGIVSIEGGPVESALTPGVSGSLKLARLVGGLGGKRLVRDRYAAGLRRASGDASWVDRSTVRQYFLGPMRDLDGTLDAMLAMAEQPEPVALVPRLPEIRVPVVLLLGGAEHEGALAAGELAALQQGLARLEVVTVPGAGHFLQEERPDAVAAAIAGLSASVASDPRSPRSGSEAARESSAPPGDNDR
jgi:pimeloyl-ACP methyl ester carboxylesterase